jgi:hypothetical protein
MVFEFTSGVRKVIKLVQETATELLEKIARSDSRMVENAMGKIQEIERSQMETSLEAVMSNIVDRFVRISDAMGQAKSNPQIEKKKDDKPATANPATKDGLQVKCQICQSEHSAKDCPRFRDLEKKSASRRGELFPGPPDKECKRRGSKDDADDESQDDFGDKVCLICMKYKLCSPRQARNHTTQECW